MIAPDKAFFFFSTEIKRFFFFFFFFFVLFLFNQKVLIFFLISPWKHMLWVLIRNTSPRHFWWVPHYMFLWRNKKNIYLIPLLSRAMISFGSGAGWGICDNLLNCTCIMCHIMTKVDFGHMQTVHALTIICSQKNKIICLLNTVLT